MKLDVGVPEGLRAVGLIGERGNVLLAFEVQ
jgi:hypothetical protein